MRNCTGPHPTPLTHDPKMSHVHCDVHTSVKSIDMLVKLCEGSRKGFPAGKWNASPQSICSKRSWASHQPGRRSRVGTSERWDEVTSILPVQMKPANHCTILMKHNYNRIIGNSNHSEWMNEWKKTNTHLQIIVILCKWMNDPMKRKKTF